LCADEPIVAVAFASVPGTWVWCKSQPARERGHPVGLYLGWYDDAGLDVRVHWDVGEGQAVSRTVLSVPATRSLPLGPDLTEMETGTLWPVFTLSGDPQVTCWALFLPARLVKTGRNRLWHLRPEVRHAVPGPLRGILSYGRAGTVADPGP